MVPYFVGARFAQRCGRFSLGAHFETIADSSLFDINMHQSGFRPGQRGFSVEGVARHRYFALWQAKGISSVEQAHNVIELTAGRWALFEACSPCSFNVVDGSRCIGVMVPERGNSRWAELIGKGGRALPRSDDVDLAAAMILESLGRSTQLDQRIQQSFEVLLLDLLDSALERSVPSSCANLRSDILPTKLRRAKELVAAQLGNPALRPENIGHAIGVSRRALYHLFSQIGETPMSYVRVQRLQEAARRLRNAKVEDTTVTRIAYDLGFADPSHFCRLFRAQYGMTPRQWGNAARSD
jgi:AraC family transcriptional regulator, positive regulator of tynA and feaB